MTPHNTNLVESAHAGRNTQTSIGLPLLSLILKSVLFPILICLLTYFRDKEIAARKVDELSRLEAGGPSAISRKCWNGLAARETLAAQRLVSKMRQTVPIGQPRSQSFGDSNQSVMTANPSGALHWILRRP